MKNSPEANEQIALIEFCRLRNILISATPNETPAGHIENGRWKTHWKSAKDAKIKGASSGVPDLTILCPCSDGKTRLIFIEMKAPRELPKKEMSFDQIQAFLLNEDNWTKKNGELKKSVYGVKRVQIEWIRALNEAQEVGAFVCYSAKQAIELVQEMMKDF